MEKEIYFVRTFRSLAEDVNGEYTCIGKDNLKKILMVLSYYHNHLIARVNKAVTCFDGYLTNGDYIDMINTKDINDKGFDKAIKGTKLFYIFND